jgi:site-specific DNA recombinase
MRIITPRIVVSPVRTCVDGGVVMRAKFRLQLANLLPDPRTRAVLQRPLERVLTVDLFNPTQPVEYRQQVMDLRKEGMTEKAVARQLDITQTAAQNAADLHRKMTALNLTDPYTPVLEPPEDLAKLRRHHHPRYRFTPLGGASEI